MISYQLKMNAGPTPGKILQLAKPELFIGRDISNDVVIADADISRKHARLVLQGEGYLLEDLGSTNGTFLNGERLTAPQTLQPGDLIRLGEAVELVFELPVAEAIETVVEAQPGAYPAGPQPPLPQPAAPQPPLPMPAAPQPVVQPPLPAETWAAAPTPARKKSKTGLIIGIGCLVLLCLCVLAGVAIYLIFFPAEVSSITW